MKRRKICKLFLGAILIFGMVAPGMAMAKEKVNVWIISTRTQAGDAKIGEQVKAFCKMKNMAVDFSVVPTEQIQAKIAAAIEAGHPPDLVQMLGHIVQYYASQDLLVDVSDIVSEIKKKGGGIYESATLPLVTKDNRQWGVPVEVELWPMYMRKDLVERAGFSAPETWEELRKIAKAAQDPSKRIYGFGIPLSKCGDATTHIRELIWAFGGKLIEADGKTVAVNSPETLAAVQFIADMYLKDKSIPPGATSWNDAGNNAIYQTGQAVFIQNPGSVYRWMLENDNTLLENTELIPWPAGPGGPSHTSEGGCIAWMAFKGANNVAFVKEMLRYLYEPDRYGEMVSAVNGRFFPIYKEVAQYPLFKSRFFKNYGKIAQDARIAGWPAPPSVPMSECDSRYLLVDMVQRVILQGMPPQKSLDILEEEMNKIYAKYQ